MSANPTYPITTPIAQIVAELNRATTDQDSVNLVIINEEGEQEVRFMPANTSYEFKLGRNRLIRITGKACKDGKVVAVALRDEGALYTIRNDLDMS